MEKEYELIIFDLDGTLLNTAKGIFNCVRYTESKMGFTPIPNSQLGQFIGPPPKQMYAQIYGVNMIDALQAAQYHREYGRNKAIFEAELYPGVVDTLSMLKGCGYKLAVSTLKTQTIAETILGNFNLSQYLNCIVGMNSNETMTKAITIKEAIRLTKTYGKVLMVGDSIYDLEGAKAIGIDFIGVSYGFGLKEPIKDIIFIDEMAELLNIVGYY